MTSDLKSLPAVLCSSIEFTRTTNLDSQGINLVPLEQIQLFSEPEVLRGALNVLNLKFSMSNLKGKSDGLFSWIELDSNYRGDGGRIPHRLGLVWTSIWKGLVVRLGQD